MTIGIYVRTAIVLMVVLVLQLELFSELRIWGVMPELLLGVAIAGAWVAGPDRGAVIGFCSGLLYDLYLPTPLALSSLSYLLIAYAVGLIAVGAQTGEAPLRRMVTLAAVPVGITLFIVLGELIGQDLYGSAYLKLVIISTLYTFVLMGSVHWLMRWAFAIGGHDALGAPVRREMVE